MKAKFKELLLPYQQKIESELKNTTVSEMPVLIKEPIDYFLKLPGKRIRPLITIITAENYHARISDALPGAVAIEILHDFTLVHDDIMDGDKFRRGFDTVHMKWDVGTALLAGDAMVAIAYKKLLQSKSAFIEDMIRAFTDGMYVVCAGQALDKEFETRNDVTHDLYLEMISQKTARLIALSFELGYLAVSNDEKYIHKLKQLGEHIGLAFQIQDDLLDFIADEKTLGKDIGSDWRKNKKTFITIKYHELASEKQTLPADLFSLPTLNDAMQALRESGIFEFARETIAGRLSQARTIAGEISFHHPVLKGLLDFLETRNY